jgi:type I restriction enzyme S subunit
MSNEAQTMKKKVKPALTPNLRFPEFRDRPKWEETILGTVLTEHGEKNDGSSEVHSVSVHKGVINQVEHLGRSFAASDRSNYNLAKPHDIIYTKSPTGDFPYGIVKQNRNPYKVIVSPLYGVFSPVNRHLGYILDSYFESPIRTTHYLAPITQKGAKNTIQISNATFLSKGIFLPALPAEQQKIADCLSSLDELIAAEGRKLETLKAHKKGLMQQLFPRPGETRPRLRFPKFRKAGEWKEKRIGDMEPFVTSGSRGWAAYYADRGSLFVRITNLSRQSILLDLTDLKFVNLPPEATEGVRTRLKAHDVLISITADIGMIGYVDERIPSPAYINQHIALVRFKTSSVSARFVAYFLAADDSQSRFRASTDNGTKAGMNLMAVQHMPLKLPAEDEQQRVASCLSSVDAQITAQVAKIDALRTHKRGLMQRLFPSDN